MKPKSLLKFPRILLAPATLLASASLSFAASLQWDADGVAPLGGTGTWDTTNTFWFTGSGYVPWINAGQVSGTTDDAVFNTAAGTVTVDAGGVTARSLKFDTGGYLLSGGALTLAGGAANVINTNHSTSATGTFATGANVTTTSSIISGSGGLTKQGAGVLSVNTAAGYTGATVVSGGVLRMGVANALPSSTLLEVQTGAALDLGGNSNVAAGFNLTVAGLTGGGRITTGQNNNSGSTLTVNIATSRTDTFTGIFGGNQAGIAGNSFSQIHFAKSGIGTLVMSGTSATATGGNGPPNNVSVTGGILQLGSQTAFTAVGWDLNTLAVGTGATFDMNGNNEGFSGTSGVGVVTNSNNSTQSVMSRNRTAGTTWATQITGNIRIQANTADVTLSNTGNSFTGGVDLTGGGGAFIINNAGQLPANQIDLANGGNLDFTANGGLTLDNTRTFTIGAGINNFRYRNTNTGVVNLAGTINNGVSPGTLVLSYHTSVVGNTTFSFSGGGNFTGTTQIGASHASPQSVTLRPGVANGIATGTIIDFGGGNSRTYSLDLNGFNQEVAGLTNTGTGTSLVQRVVTSSAAASQVFTVNNAANHTFSGVLGGTGTNNNNFALTKSAAGTLTLSGTNTYTGATNVTNGKLVVNGSISTSSLTTVKTGATLGGSGTVGATLVESGGTFAPGNSPDQIDISGSLSLDPGSFTTMEIDGTTRATGYDAADVSGALAYGGTLRLDFGVLFDSVGTYTFDLFNFASQSSSFFAVNLTDQYTGALVNNGFGVWSTTISNNTWTFDQGNGNLTLAVVPEPSAALLGGLGTLLLLRRRRI